MKVLFANDYPMVEARVGWRQGVYPAHHLWGTSTLEDHGYEVVDLTLDIPKRAPRAQRAIEAFIGDAGQQWRALRATRRGDAIVYAADSTSTRALTIARGVSRRFPPTVTVVHEVPRNVAARRLLSAVDCVVTFSTAVTQELVDGGMDPERVITGRWGPDLAFSGYDDAADDGFVVATGKTRRDYRTLLDAVAALGVPTRIYLPNDDRSVCDLAERLPNVASLPLTGQRLRGTPLTYAHVIDDIARASVIAIPLASPRRAYGLTELNDALGLGKPVVMTRNRYIDVDVEAIGCGLVVAKGDRLGWRHALESLMEDDARRSEMGARGRAWAESHWNAQLFDSDLRTALRNAADAGA